MPRSGKTQARSPTWTRRPEKRNGLRDDPPTSRLQAWHAWFILILGLGMFARVWEFGLLPPGLNADEASIGVEAWNLLHYGMDRNGNSFPVHFVSWGSGQNALYGYILMPFVGLFGLKPFAIRIPMMIAAVLSMPIIYDVGARLGGRRLGLVAMFLLAISPWHILLSRWALESNILPLIFLLAFACLLRLRHNQRWFIAACALLGICLYAYGTAYAVVPIFMVVVTIVVARKRLLTGPLFAGGVITFAVVATPIAVLLLINAFDLAPIRFGPLTIPRFPVQARYEVATLIGAQDLLAMLALNLREAFRVLIAESDGLLYNVVEPFGTFYRISAPLAILGIAGMAKDLRTRERLPIIMLWAWLGASAPLPLFQALNINRFNVAFFPLLLCIAYGIIWWERRLCVVLPAFVAILTLAFAGFTAAYHGTAYRKQAEWKFSQGFLPALESVKEAAGADVCITDKVTMPYIFMLFVEPIDPSVFIETVRYVDPAEPLRRVLSYGRYTFGTRNCKGANSPIYVLTADETPPRLGNRYNYEFFDYFVVYRRLN